MCLAGTNSKTNKHSSFWLGNVQKFPKWQQCKDFQIKKTEDEILN